MQVPDKSQMRRYFRELRQNQDSRLAATAGARVRQRLLGLEIMSRAKVVLMYLPTKGEVDTWPLLDHFWETDVTPLLPRCRVNEPGLMDIHPVRSRTDLGPGRFGLIEPRPDTTVPLVDPAPDVVIIPALAFDRAGFRLGFGGGYYDRFLATLSARPPIIGLAYDFQIVDRLPTDSWDKPVTMIITPATIITPNAETKL